VGLDCYLDSCHRDLVAQDVGGLGVETSDSPRQRWTLGAGSEMATLKASRYELFRALGGRRSEHQIRAMDWIGDVDPMIGVLSRYPLPTSDLVENP
jgi:hypothetical protein